MVGDGSSIDRKVRQWVTTSIEFNDPRPSASFLFSFYWCHYETICTMQKLLKWVWITLKKSFNLLFFKSVGFMDFCALFVKVCPNHFKLWLNGYDGFISLKCLRICLCLYFFNISLGKLFLLNYLSQANDVHFDRCPRNPWKKSVFATTRNNILNVKCNTILLDFILLHSRSVPTRFELGMFPEKRLALKGSIWKCVHMSNGNWIWMRLERP